MPVCLRPSDESLQNLTLAAADVVPGSRTNSARGAGTCVLDSMSSSSALPSIRVFPACTAAAYRVSELPELGHLQLHVRLVEDAMRTQTHRGY